MAMRSNRWLQPWEMTWDHLENALAQAQRAELWWRWRECSLQAELDRRRRVERVTPPYMPPAVEKKPRKRRAK